MPDPRSVTFSTQIVFGGDKWADAFDEYGHKPGQKGFDPKKIREREWETFHAFQGEFARLYGPKRRGISFEMGRKDVVEDDEDWDFTPQADLFPDEAAYSDWINNFKKKEPVLDPLWERWMPTFSMWLFNPLIARIKSKKAGLAGAGEVPPPA